MVKCTFEDIFEDPNVFAAECLPLKSYVLMSISSIGDNGHKVTWAVWMPTPDLILFII